jgi:hypothetical protein
MIEIDSKTEFHVKRILALIAYANNEIDEEERQLLTSSITASPGLSEQEVVALLQDVSEMPAVEKLVSEISSSDGKRYLLFNLFSLLTLKHDMNEKEVEAVIATIEALELPAEFIEQLRSIISILLAISKHLEREKAISQ